MLENIINLKKKDNKLLAKIKVKKTLLLVNRF